jgi:hypothetical protein
MEKLLMVGIDPKTKKQLRHLCRGLAITQKGNGGVE